MMKLKSEKILTMCLLLFNCSVLLPQESDYTKIGIVHSELTKQLLYKNDDSFYPILDWELFFLNKKIQYSVIEDNDLNFTDFYEFDILILPSVEILSDRAIENLKEYLNDGKNIFVLGKLGLYDPYLKIRKPKAIEILTGLAIAEIPVENLISEKISFFNSNFLTQDYNGESDYLILNSYSPLYVEKTSFRTNSLGSYILSDQDNLEKDYFTGAAAIENEHGKVLWFGFQLSQVSLNEDDRQLFDEIVLNGLSWLADNPLVWVNPYPEFYRSATLFSVWINKTTTTLNRLIPIFKRRNVALNFFLSPPAVKKIFKDIYKLSAVGNQNLLIDPFDYLNSDSTQIQSVLEENSQILKAGSRQKYFGVQLLNPYEKDFNEYKLKSYFDFNLSSELKFSYLNSEENINPMQNITYYYLNDYLNLIRGDGGLDPEYFEQLYEDLNNTGGIVSYIIKGDLISNLNTLFEENLELIIGSSRLNNSYITTFQELLDWFKTKDNIEVNISDLKDESIVLIEVKNISDVIVENIGLNIFLPSCYKNSTLIDFNFNLKYNGETGYYNLLIPFIRSQQTLAFEIDYRK